MDMAVAGFVVGICLLEQELWSMWDNLKGE
jgi:hypothetical protein